MSEKVLDAHEKDIFTKLLLTFGNVDAADQFIDITFANKLSYSKKFEILEKYFDFKMIGGYDPVEQTKEEKVKNDYLYTLQHLLNKAKMVGIENVIKV